MASTLTKNINSNYTPTFMSGYPIYAYGGVPHMYGFGSWLKSNAGNILQTAAGAGAMLIPGAQDIGTGLMTSGISGLATTGDTIGKQQEQQQNAILEQQKRDLVANLPAQHNYVPTFAEGGSIHIKPSKRGTFTAQATKMGMGIQEAASKILNAPEGKYSPAMRKKANFARNASKWKHADGGELSPKDFTLAYIKSPKYQERLISSGYSPEEEIASRLGNVSQTNTYGQYGPINLLKQAQFKSQGRPFTSQGGSAFMPESNAVVVDHKQAEKYGLPPTSIEAHEYGHSEVNTGDWEVNPETGIRGTRLNEYDAKQIIDRLKPGANKVYQKAPDEIKSDLNALRYELFNKGLYDTGKEDFNQNILNKIDKSYIKDRLQKNYSDEDLIWMMNNIARVQNNSNKQVTATGGLLNSYAGDGKLDMLVQKNGGQINDRLNEITSGSTHEQSPMNGVPVTNNALLEDKEFLYTTKDGKKYVFSNRF